MRRKMMLFLTCIWISVGLVFAQNRTVTGIVISEEDGEPIIGASVLVEGTTMGAITDMNGKFVLNGVPASAKKLKGNYISVCTNIDVLLIV